MIGITEAINLNAFAGNPAPVVYLNGTLLFIAGLSIIQGHHRQTRGWTVLLTAIGWLLLAGGLYRMVLPAAPQIGKGPVADAIFFALSAAGLFLTYKGYIAAHRNPLDLAPRDGLTSTRVDRECFEVNEKNQHLSPAEAASRLGVTQKALRIYEARGLVAPLRSVTGWRTYGPAEMARLHQVLALKGLGLPLAQIAKLLRGPLGSLAQVLELQEQTLSRESARVGRALDLFARRAASSKPAKISRSTISPLSPRRRR